MEKCRKSFPQEYQCQVMCKMPNGKLIAFDACLAKELFYLWDLGIETTGSCCGRHVGNKEGMAFIGVLDKYIPKMKSLGYKVAYNSVRPLDEDSFYPMSIKEG